MIALNQPAPPFRLQNQAGQWLQLADFQGRKNLVLYFYPKDDTPGCTLEAQQFTQLAGEFAALDTVVLGISKDSCASHQAFIDKYQLQVELLADSDGQVCEAYDVWREKEKDGVKKMAILRSTFIIDKQGVLTYSEHNVNPEGHAQAILARLSADA
ncbi:MAG: peroxiredoxin [Methylococcales bacterium]|nr:peroxiredoxin [Methylococcales bacterium]